MRKNVVHFAPKPFWTVDFDGPGPVGSSLRQIDASERDQIAARNFRSAAELGLSLKLPASDLDAIRKVRLAIRDLEFRLAGRA